MPGRSACSRSRRRPPTRPGVRPASPRRPRGQPGPAGSPRTGRGAGVRSRRPRRPRTDGSSCRGRCARCDGSARQPARADTRPSATAVRAPVVGRDYLDSFDLDALVRDVLAGPAAPARRRVLPRLLRGGGTWRARARCCGRACTAWACGRRGRGSSASCAGAVVTVETPWAGSLLLDGDLATRRRSGWARWLPGGGTGPRTWSARSRRSLRPQSRTTSPAAASTAAQPFVRTPQRAVRDEVLAEIADRAARLQGSYAPYGRTFPGRCPAADASCSCRPSAACSSTCSSSGTWALATRSSMLTRYFMRSSMREVCTHDAALPAAGQRHVASAGASPPAPPHSVMIG